MMDRVTDLHVFPCSSKTCRHRTCSRKIIVEPDNPFEDETGECWLPAFCYDLQPPEEFKIRMEEYERYEVERFTKSTREPKTLYSSSNPPDEQTANDTSGFTKPKRGGVSAYAGRTVAGFTVNNESTRLSVKGRSFDISRKTDCNLIDQIITAAQNCQYDYRIQLSTKDYNALSPGGKLVADTYVERELRKGKGNEKYTGFARLKQS